MLLTHVQFIVCLDPLPKSLSTKVLSSQSASLPSCTSAWDYSVPGTGPFPLQLLNFMKFLLAHLCGVLGSLRRAGLASTTWTVSPTSSSQFAVDALHPFSHLVSEMWNTTGLSISPWRAPILTSHQLDFVLLTTTIWAQQRGQFFICFVAYFFSSYEINQFLRALWVACGGCLLEIKVRDVSHPLLGSVTLYKARSRHLFCFSPFCLTRKMSFWPRLIQANKCLTVWHHRPYLFVKGWLQLWEVGLQCSLNKTVLFVVVLAYRVC